MPKSNTIMSRFVRRHLPIILIWSFLTITSGCTSVPLENKSDASDADKLFEVLDVDGNGKVSRQEAKAGFQYLIASYDRGNGVEILAAKSSGSMESKTKRKSKRRPSSQDATRAFESLFDQSRSASEELSRDQFKKLVVKSSDNPDTDPFSAFY